MKPKAQMQIEILQKSVEEYGEMVEKERAKSALAATALRAIISLITALFMAMLVLKLLISRWLF